MSVVFFGGLFFAGYVLVNGLGDTYELFGADGAVLDGGMVILGSLAASGSAFCLRRSMTEVMDSRVGRDGMVQSRTKYEFEPRFVTASIALAVVAIGILISGM